MVERRVKGEEDMLVVTAGERATKGETCVDQMTDSFQAHKDDAAILEPSACDAFRACEETVLRCMCSVYGCTVCIAIELDPLLPVTLMNFCPLIITHLFFGTEDKGVLVSFCKVSCILLFLLWLSFFFSFGGGRHN